MDEAVAQVDFGAAENSTRSASRQREAGTDFVDGGQLREPPMWGDTNDYHPRADYA